jgi:hypothetical protein
VVDYTEQANNAFARFAAAGMHIIQSTEELEITKKGKREQGTGNR